MLIALIILFAQTSPAPELVTRETGGSIVVKLSSSIALNKGSSLQRERIGLRHAGFPAEVVGAPGVVCTYADSSSRYSTGGYEYAGPITVKINEPIAAIEVKVLLFDVWGDKTENLVAHEIKDFEPGTVTFSEWSWKEYSEPECSQQRASLTYVSRVRTKDGRVLQADPKPVLTEARRFSKTLTEGDLEAKPAPPPGK